MQFTSYLPHSLSICKLLPLVDKGTMDIVLEYPADKEKNIER